jgi:hypothetical protein
MLVNFVAIISGLSTRTLATMLVCFGVDGIANF